MWWYTAIIPVLRRQMQKDQEFDTSLGYPCEFMTSLVYTVLYMFYCRKKEGEKKKHNSFLFFPF